MRRFWSSSEPRDPAGDRPLSQVASVANTAYVMWEEWVNPRASSRICGDAETKRPRSTSYSPHHVSVAVVKVNAAIPALLLFLFSTASFSMTSRPGTFTLCLDPDCGLTPRGPSMPRSIPARPTCSTSRLRGSMSRSVSRACRLRRR